MRQIHEGGGTCTVGLINRSTGGGSSSTSRLMSSSFFCFRVIVIASDVCFLFLALDSEALRLEAEDDDALHEKIRAVVLTFMPFMVNISVDSK